MRANGATPDPHASVNRTGVALTWAGIRVMMPLSSRRSQLRILSALLNG